MITVRTIICKLGGQSYSNPEIIKSYPPLDLSSEQSQELISKCLPVGIKIDNEAESGLEELLIHLENMCPELEEDILEREKIEYLVKEYSTNIM
ncbi:MAG: hypothetical protein ACXAC5_11200 [Promethearchaeota archaeon]|jgi:hypothetical protein